MRYVAIILLILLVGGCSTTNADRLTLEALAHLDEGRIGEALPLFEAAHRKNPDDPAYRYNLLFAKLQDRAFEPVVEGCEEAFGDHPLHLEFLFLKARAQRELNRIEDAIETYRRIVTLNPGDLKTLRALLSEAMEHGLREEAVFLAETMLRTDPSNAIALKTLAEADPASWYAPVHSYLTKEDPSPIR
ncbi:MAG: tetratricopeptide repeat protein [Spirochaetales bacterium]|nr:tetratricopeptide repeat protein [Spirochaetales bacterium]